MNQLEVEFPTKLSVEECAGAFRAAVQKSYGASRKLIGGLSALRGNGGGIEFFTPSDGPFDAVNLPPGKRVPSCRVIARCTVPPRWPYISM